MRPNNMHSQIEELVNFCSFKVTKQLTPYTLRKTKVYDCGHSDCKTSEKYVKPESEASK